MLEGLGLKSDILSIGPLQGERVCKRILRYICFKFNITGHRIHQLGSLTDLAKISLFGLPKVVDSIAFNQGFVTNYILNIWCMLVHPTMVLLKVAILFKILSWEDLNEIWNTFNGPLQGERACIRVSDCPLFKILD